MNDQDGQTIDERTTRMERARRAALWCRASKAFDRGAATYDQVVAS